MKLAEAYSRTSSLRSAGIRDRPWQEPIVNYLLIRRVTNFCKGSEMTRFLLADFLDQVGRFLNRMVQFGGSASTKMQTEHWIAVVAVMLVVGYICMKGLTDPRSL